MGGYQCHAEEAGVRPGDAVVHVAAVAQQLQQEALHAPRVGGLAALDQLLAAPQQVVHPTRVLTHRLLEGLRHSRRREPAA